MADFDDLDFSAYEPDTDHEIQLALQELEDFFKKQSEKENKLSLIESREKHKNHTIIRNSANGEFFYVCKECKKEVL
jgi:hypothetical protein